MPDAFAETVFEAHPVIRWLMTEGRKSTWSGRLS